MPQAKPTPATSRQALSRRYRLWLLIWSALRFFIVFPLWLVGVVALLLGVALSPWGTGLLLSQGQERGWWVVEDHQGGLLDEFQLSGFRLDVAGTEVRIDHLELAWADDCVLSGELCLDMLRVEGADIRLPSGGVADEAPPADPDAAGGPMAINFPFPVALRELVLDDVTLHLPDGSRFSWIAFRSSLEASGGRVDIAATHLENPRLYLPPSEGARLAPSDDADGISAAAIDASIALQNPLSAPSDEASKSDVAAERTSIELPDIQLPVDVRLAALTVNDIDVIGRFSYLVERFSLGVETQGSDVLIDHLEVVSPDATFSLAGNVTLRDDYPLTLRADAELFLEEPLPALNGQTLALDLSGSLSDLTARLDAQGAVNAALEGQVDALAPEFPFQLNLQSEQVTWPLPSANVSLEDDAEEGAQDDAFIVDNIDLQVRGDLDAYEVRLGLKAQGPGIPETDIAVSGQGDTGHFNWQPLTLAAGDSRLTSEGRVDWSDTLAVDAQVALEQFNPALFNGQLEGDIDGELAFNVRQQASRWRVDVPRLTLDGELRDYPLQLEAAFDANSDLQANIERFRFRQGENRLSASGSVQPDELSVDATIDLRELQSLSPNLAGIITGDIDARGSLEQPQLQATLNADALRFAQNRVGQLRLTANVSGLDDPQLDVALAMENLEAGGQSLETANLTLDGRLSSHQLAINVEGQPNGTLERALLSLNGQFDQAAQRYRARVTPLEIDAQAGDIRLEAPLDINYDLASSEARLSPFCLRREQGGRLCADDPTVASPDQGQTALNVRDIPIEALEPWLPEGWQVEGDTTADVAAQWRQGGRRWQADVEVLGELGITAINDYGQPVELPRISLDTQVTANQGQADGNVVLSLEEAGNIALDVSVSDPLGAGELSGSLVADEVSLAPYRPMVVALDALAGELNGRVDIAGTTRQPDLQGELSLLGIQANGPDIPVDIQDGEVNVTFDGEEGTVDGFLAAERGRLNIEGDAYWPADEDWRLGIDLDGTQSPILVVLPEFGRLEAAPDIRVRVTPDRLQVRGNVDLPWSRLEVGDLPSSAVSPSPDEVIITERDDREAEREARRAAERGDDAPSAADELADSGMELDVLITLTLGRGMRIEAYGLESGLGGTLEIRQDSGSLQLFGEVNLIDGRFQAFGQDLLIRRGQLLFSGPPGLPVLDFEAIRNPDVTEDDVIAGLRVTGNAEQPNISIFSEPAMNESRALSYVLRGRAPDDAGGGVDSALTTALIGMSLGRTGGAVGSIGEAFGIDDLTLDTAGAGDDSQVALSGQLTDDLRISYGVGIFSPIAELTLRYTLWRNLYVQAVSGANQAVDLIYTFSRAGNPTIFDQQ
ncbi:translocation/assembly module TamB domain-containing protein [Halomonas sp. CUBES01]|uniref:autotransporter assembly complex protein TamB n=1 Tax=Halomonas sp. CUBES01 TaxID=2897340 RepID=UPI001E53AD2E|nr:translocation/assembly module TamB domain-containing protein [Halomonas sp. CUBES01]MEC4767324.1 translocation/assembly module TamB domain-containing protein [Halomonas sp. CUBES01]